MLNRFISRWLFSIAKELYKEAMWCREQGDEKNAKLLLCIGTALNLADGKLSD